MLRRDPNGEFCGRGKAISLFQKRQLPYVINWDSISLDNTPYLAMPDPFETYERQVGEMLEKGSIVE